MTQIAGGGRGNGLCAIVTQCVQKSICEKIQSTNSVSVSTVLNEIILYIDLLFTSVLQGLHWASSIVDTPFDNL